MSKTYDVAIIGAGVAGLGAAYFLAQHRDVIVLEQEAQPAYHSSGRSAAMYIEGYENEVVAQLTAQSGAFFKSPPSEFCEHALLHPRGGLTIATQGQESALQEYLHRWQPLCPELHTLSQDKTLELVPYLRSDWLAGAVYDPTWQSIDVHELISTYRRGLKHHGGTLQCNSQVTTLDYESRQSVWRIETHSGDYQAHVLINAAGAWASEIATLAGASPIQLTPMRRSAAIIPLPDATEFEHQTPGGLEAGPLVHTMSENLYFKPESPGLMVSPCDETPVAPMDAYAHDLDIAEALAELEKVSHIQPQQVLHTWAGLRTFSADRRPVVGRDPQQPAFFWLAGQGGFGVQTSPGLGALTCEALINGKALPSSVDVARF